MAVSQVNTTAQILGGVIQKLVTEGEAVALAYLQTQIPFFALPIISSLASALLSWLVDPLETYMINSATGIVIKFQTSSEQSAVVNAATALQIAQNSGNQVAIEKAVQDAKAAYAGLLTWDGIFAS